MIFYNLKVSDNELRVIDAALAEMPYRIAAPVIQQINQQLSQKDQSNTDAN